MALIGGGGVSEEPRKKKRRRPQVVDVAAERAQTYSRARARALARKERGIGRAQQRAARRVQRAEAFETALRGRIAHH